MDPDIPYLLLTPGPLTTSHTVRRAMRFDYCTWEADYTQLVTEIRQKLVELATDQPGYTSVLMQGSGTFSVEATLGSVLPPAGKILILNNGVYGHRMVLMADRLRIAYRELACPDTSPPDLELVRAALDHDSQITHVAMVHCETTTGILNPAAEVGQLARQFGKSFIVDAMSTFGGIPLSMEELCADFLISSANKCIQGTPGFGFVIARRSHLEATCGWARSLSLDLYDQWQELEGQQGKWRYTSPTHAVRAFHQALLELDEEGGVAARYQRYRENQRILSEGMRQLGFQPVLPAWLQSPIITAFPYPEGVDFDFDRFYEGLKRRRFVLYPGKVADADRFRVASIGHVFPDDMREFVLAVGEVLDELGVKLR